MTVDMDDRDEVHAVKLRCYFCNGIDLGHFKRDCLKFKKCRSKGYDNFEEV